MPFLFRPAWGWHSRRISSSRPDDVYSLFPLCARGAAPCIWHRLFFIDCRQLSLSPTARPRSASRSMLLTMPLRLHGQCSSFDQTSSGPFQHKPGQHRPELALASSKLVASWPCVLTLIFISQGAGVDWPRTRIHNALPGRGTCMRPGALAANLLGTKRIIAP